MTTSKAGQIAVRPLRSMSSRFMLLRLLLGSLIVVHLLGVLNRPFGRDELEAIHSAWKVFSGRQIYIDFFQHHHPLLYFSTAPLFYLFGDSTQALFAMRGLMFAMVLVIFWTVYQLASELIDPREYRWVSLILLTTVTAFYEEIFFVKPDVPQVLFGLLGVLALFRFYRQGRIFTVVAAALALGISFLFLQKAVVLIALVSAMVVVDGWRKRISAGAVALFLTVGAVTLLAYPFYELVSGRWAPYWTFNWVINYLFQDRFSAIATLGLVAEQNSIFWILAIIGVVVRCRSLLHRRLLFLMSGLILSVVVMPSPYQRYLLPALPLVAIFASAGMQSISQRLPRLFWLCLIIAIALPASYLRFNLINGNSAQLAKIEYVLAQTEPTDRVYDGQIAFNLFREDIDFFWFSLAPGHGGLSTYQSMVAYDYDLYQSIAEHRPKILSDYQIDRPDDPRIRNFYRRSLRYPDIRVRCQDGDPSAQTAVHEPDRVD